MKKRILTSTLALCLIVMGLFVFVACNKNNNSPVGYYYLYSLQIDETQGEITRSQLDVIKAKGELATEEEKILLVTMQKMFKQSLELKSDNTLVMVAEQTATGSWVQSGNKVTIKVNEEEDVANFVYKNGTLTIVKKDNKMIMVFKKIK